MTVMFLQLAVGGHLLLFVVRTKRSLFQPPYPSARLSWAIVATQLVAVVVCLVGVGVRAIPPAAIVAVWIYCLGCARHPQARLFRAAAAREHGLARQRISLAS